MSITVKNMFLDLPAFPLSPEIDSQGACVVENAFCRVLFTGKKIQGGVLLFKIRVQARLG